LLASRTRAAPGPFHIRPYARVLSAVVLGVATGLMVVRSMDLPAALSSVASPTQIAVEGVLGAVGTAAPTPRPSIEPRLKAMSDIAPRTPLSPSSEPTPTEPPIVVPPTQPTVAPVTPGPTPPASPAPTPSIAPTPSPFPTPTPTPTPSPTPTGTPTPTPTETPAPTASASATL
jgi:hypothetical protein